MVWFAMDREGTRLKAPPTMERTAHLGMEPALTEREWTLIGGLKLNHNDPMIKYTCPLWFPAAVAIAPMYCCVGCCVGLSG